MDNNSDEYLVKYAVMHMVSLGTVCTTTGNWIFSHNEIANISKLDGISREWVTKHENDIYKGLIADRRVASVELTSDKCFDIVFYLDYCAYLKDEDNVNKTDLSTVKDKDGKPRMSLILPNANAAVVRIREYGLQKYPDANNWRNVDNADWLDAAMRHLLKYLDGAEYDTESGYPHLWHALCDLSYLVEKRYPTALWEKPDETKE